MLPQWQKMAQLCLSRAKQLRLLRSKEKGSPPPDVFRESIHKLQQQELEAIIYDHRLTPNPILGWDNVFGLDQVVKVFQELIQLPLQRLELLEGDITAPRAILLFGPPGCGKSLLLAVLCSEADITVFDISAATLISKWQGETQKMVRALYTVSWREAPSIIFIDEFDGLFSSPSQLKGNPQASITAIQLQKELLQYMDGVKTPEVNQTVLVAATNFPRSIQPSLLRRFDRILYVHPPDSNTIRALLEHLLRGIDHTLTSYDLQRLSMLFRGYTPDEIKKVCEAARLCTYADLRLSPTKYHPSHPPRALQSSDIEACLPLVEPMLKHLKDIEGVSTLRFRNWNRQFGRPHITYPLESWEKEDYTSKRTDDNSSR
jgi:SpoVK/Ycf46/Vps4 family AAA+-type ATPase